MLPQEGQDKGAMFESRLVSLFIIKYGGTVMAKSKTTGFYFKASEQEMKWIEERMEQTNIRNKSAFLRKMAIDGHIINLDLAELNEIGRLLRITAGNVNQIARHLNSGGGIHSRDIEDMNNQFAAIRADFGKLLTSLSGISDPKPGKRFIAPPTIRDLPEYNKNGEGA
jgi:hypothetical protein